MCCFLTAFVGTRHDVRSSQKNRNMWLLRIFNKQAFQRSPLPSRRRPLACASHACFISVIYCRENRLGKHLNQSQSNPAFLNCSSFCLLSSVLKFIDSNTYTNSNFSHILLVFLLNNLFFLQDFSLIFIISNLFALFPFPL